MSWAPPSNYLFNFSTPTFCFTKFPQIFHPSFSPNLSTFKAVIKKSHKKPPFSSLTSTQETEIDSPLEAENSYSRHKAAPFIEEVKQNRSNLDPVELLEGDEDWTQEQFWDVIELLKKTRRPNQILQVFDHWKEKEESRINEENYVKIVGVLFEEGLTEAAASALGQMKGHAIRISLPTYSGIIEGFARKGRFDDALFYLKEMKDTGLRPETETYNGLIRAYGKYKMYDEMGGCLKEMESSGIVPGHVTYNLLIREFAKAGLLKKMERTYQALLGNKMELQASTLISMLGAYTKFRILDKMEKYCRRVLRLKACVDDDLIRAVAEVYIEKLMFSRLEDLGVDVSLRSGSTDLVWCLRILSHACICSRKGMHSIIQEMESNELPWNVTIANILALTFLRMKDFTRLNILLTELPCRFLKPDIVTVGILFDACFSGFDGTRVKKTWRRAGYFQDNVEMETDPLVLIAFGKGQFLRDFEDIYSSIDAASKNRSWNYNHLIKLIATHRKGILAEEV